MGKIRPWLFAEWMPGAGDHQDAVQFGGFQCPQTRQDMADVWRIKGTAEYPIDHERFQIDISYGSRPQVEVVAESDWRECISVSPPPQERAYVEMRKFAIQMYRWSEDWETFLEEIRSFDYFQGVELFASAAAEFSSRRLFFMRTLDRAGFRLAGVYGGGPLHHGELASGVQKDLRMMLGFVRDCGGDVLIFGPSPRPRDRHIHRDDFRRLADELEALGESARRYQLDVAVHPRLGSVVESETELSLLLGMTSARHVRLAFDPAHLAAAGMDPLEILDIHCDRIAYVHLKDLLPPKEPGKTAGEGRGEGLSDEPFFTGLGEGFLDIPAMLRRIKTSAYPGWVTLEVGHGGESPLEKIQRGITYLQRHG
jgi:inosose dehydratase